MNNVGGPKVERHKQLMELKDFILLGTQQCLNCGSLMANQSLFCSSCRVSLFKISSGKGLYLVQRKEIQCIGLFLWKENENKLLNRLILKLKGSRQKKGWEYYSEKFIEALFLYHQDIVNKIQNQLKENKNNVIIVPCPQVVSARIPDHAELFAKELSKKLGISMQKLIVKKRPEKQKSKTKYDREGNSEDYFDYVHEEYEKITDQNQKHILFIDDIVTTGNTIRAAFLKFNKFREFTVLSLAIRE